MIILDRLPFYASRTEVVVAGKKAVVRPYQITAWASLTVAATRDFPQGTPRFPLILDTGNNHNLSIQEQHLREWCELSPELLEHRPHVRIDGHRVPLFEADLWLFQNVAESRDRLKNEDPVRLELPDGIVVYPEKMKNAARLPTLGLRALVSNRLLFTLDGVKMRVSLLNVQ